MKKPRQKRTNPVPEAYDLHLMEHIKAQLALAREMTQLATELRACVAQIERTLRDRRTDNVIRLSERT
jgi:GAF domain-containing protein